MADRRNEFQVNDAMTDISHLCLPVADIPVDSGWLHHQPYPVIGIGPVAMDSGPVDNVDVVVATAAEAQMLVSNIDAFPLAATAFVQVLRCVDSLPVQSGMTVESLAYGTLQGGTEFQAWLESRDERPRTIAGVMAPLCWLSVQEVLSQRY